MSWWKGLGIQEEGAEAGGEAGLRALCINLRDLQFILQSLGRGVKDRRMARSYE